MLLPTQQAAGTYLADFMRSMLRDIEERRQEETRKAQGKTEDKQEKALKAQLRPDETAAAANAKINAHFFGALKSDENPMAKLISKFASDLGVTQENGESSADFADRLQEAVMMAGFAREYADGETIPITLRTLAVKAEQVKAIMQGETSADDDPYATLAARIAKQAGIDPNDDDASFGIAMEKALTDARAKYPASVEAVEESSGLRKLGLKAEELIEAIRRPWSDAARKVKAALDNQAAVERTLDTDTRKAIQRLEEAADPKSSEELKAERTRKDPTRVEDAETRAEREDDIQTREMQEKVEEVRKRQDVIGERIRETGETGAAGEGAESGGVDPMQFIQVLAAGAEASKSAAEATSAAAGRPDEGLGAVDDGDPETLSADEQAYIVATHTPEGEMRDELAAGENVLTVSIDEIGIYKLAAREKKAA